MTCFLQHKAKQALMESLKLSLCPLTMPEPQFYIVSVLWRFQPKCQLVKKRKSQSPWHLRLFLERVAAQHHGPSVTLCHFRVYMPAGVTKVVQPSLVTLLMFSLAFPRSRKKVQVVISTRRKAKFNTNGFYRTQSISPCQCSEQSVAVTEYCYHFVVHFCHFIDR